MSFKVNQLIFRGVTCCIFFIFSFTSAEDPVAALPTFTYDDAEIAAAKKAILERTNMYRCMHNAVPLEMDEEVNTIILTPFLIVIRCHASYTDIVIINNNFHVCRLASTHMSTL